MAGVSKKDGRAHTVPVLELERVVLRPLKLADAADLLETYSDAEAMRFRQNPPFRNLDDARAMVREALESAKAGKAIRWAIEEKSSHKVIGTFLWKTEHGSAESMIGYSLNKRWWGRGIITEVATAVVTMLFEKVNVRVLTATVNKDNLPSIRLLRKLGFTQVEERAARLVFRRLADDVHA